jgi:hypothetical protein
MVFALRDLGTLVFSEHYDLIAIGNLSYSLHHNPMLCAMVVHLKG